MKTTAIPRNQLIDSSSKQPTFLLEEEGGRYIQLSASAYHLIQLVEQGVPFEEIAQQAGSDTTAEDIQGAYESLQLKIETIVEAPQRHPFWLKIPLLPSGWVNQISIWLKWAFRPSISRSLLFLTTVAFVWAVSQAQAFSFERNSVDYFTGYFLFLISILFHEFGHATATAYYNLIPKRIGVAIYLIYPVFYSDVSSAWRLTRKQRVVVDLGGMYFQIMVGAIYAILYWFTNQGSFYIALMMIVGSGIFSLNPFFKFDGYWLLSDALGVTNLHQQASQLIQHLTKKIMGQSPKPLPWPVSVITFLSIYTFFVTIVWGVFIWFIVPHAWNILSSYPATIQLFAAQLTQGIVTIEHVRDFFAESFVALTMCLIIWRIFRKLLEPLFNKFV